jgi:hypothetical protein
MNTTNLKTNKIFGHKLELPKAENTTRLISLNVNGICRGDDYQDVLEMAQAFKTSSVDLTTLRETNLDWRSAAQNKVYEKFQQVYHQTRLSTSSSTIHYNTIYQPGGTLTIATDKSAGRVTGVGNDKEFGRWSYIEILGKHGRKVILVTVYKVCQQQTQQVGSQTAHIQQVSLLLRQGPNRRTRVISNG